MFQALLGAPILASLADSAGERLARAIDDLRADAQFGVKEAKLLDLRPMLVQATAETPEKVYSLIEDAVVWRVGRRVANLIVSRISEG